MVPPTPGEVLREKQWTFLPPEACWEYSLAVLLVSWNIFSTSNFIAVFLPGGGGHLMKEQLQYTTALTTIYIPVEVSPVSTVLTTVTGLRP